MRLRPPSITINAIGNATARVSPSLFRADHSTYYKRRACSLQSRGISYFTCACNTGRYSATSLSTAWCCCVPRRSTIVRTGIPCTVQVHPQADPVWRRREMSCPQCDNGKAEGRLDRRRDGLGCMAPVRRGYLLPTLRIQRVMSHSNTKPCLGSAVQNNTIPVAMHGRECDDDDARLELL